jgi:hypothetical protein
MAIPERLQLRQKLQRSAREWIKIFGEEMDKPRKKGLGSDFSPKSSYSQNLEAPTTASGRSKEISYEIITNDNGDYEIIFGLPGYILAVDGGVKGDRYPNTRGGGLVRSLVNWIETKNIRTELSTLSLAFAIRTNILKEGIAPTNILSTVNERFLNEYGEQIADDYMTSMEDYIIDNIKRLEERYK